MARVDEWAADFFARHTERIPRGDWPEGDSLFWVEFRDALESEGASESEADAASKLLFRRPARFGSLEAHVEAFFARLADVRQAHRVSLPQPPAGDSERDHRRAVAWYALSPDERAHRLTETARRFPFWARWPGCLLVIAGDELLGDFDPATAPPEWRRPAPEIGRRAPEATARRPAIDRESQARVLAEVRLPSPAEVEDAARELARRLGREPPEPPRAAPDEYDDVPF